MKYDEYGIPCGFDDFECVKKFMEPDDATEYFERMKDDIPWQEITWRANNPLPRLVFRYGEFERRIHKHPVLEELIEYIEAVVETNVLGVWCNLYRDEKDYTPYQQYNYESHVMTMSFGSSRKLSIRKIEENTSPSKKQISTHTLSNGDLFYSSSEINKNHEHAILKSVTNKEIHISVVFFIDEPYSHRKRHFRYINLLGYGKIPVWFEGPESQFPEDAVATIIPTHIGENYGNFFPAELSFMRSRPDFDINANDDLSPDTLQSIMQILLQGDIGDDYQGYL